MKGLMAKAGKRYRAAAAKVDQDRRYPLLEAIETACSGPKAKFDETVEIAVRLGVDARHADQMIRGSLVPPHGIGKERRVLVFAKGEKEREARDAGADFVGAEDLVEKIQGGWLDFDTAVATPDLMGVVGRLGKVLGPRGLMPNPKSGTVSFDVARMVREVKAGKVEFRVDKAGIVHAPLGKASFSTQALVENASALLEALIRMKPASTKGQYLRTIAISTTMGPGVRVDHQQVASDLR